jgi:hypothetical protein
MSFDYYSNKRKCVLLSFFSSFVNKNKQFIFLYSKKVSCDNDALKKRFALNKNMTFEKIKVKNKIF